jgi:hypothetical protein
METRNRRVRGRHDSQVCVWGGGKVGWPDPEEKVH